MRPLTPTERFIMSTEKNEPETVVYDITDAAPTMEPKTRTKVKKVAAIGVLAAGTLLLIDDQVKRFRNRKNVHVVVTDNETDSSDTPET